MNALEEEKQKYLQIKSGLDKYKDNLINSKEQIFKIYNDPLLIDDFLLEFNSKLFNLDFHKHMPYFARINYEDQDGSEFGNLYIGKVGFANIDKDTLIIDWRSPVCDLYYNGELGENTYFVQDKPRKAKLFLKRQINFENGKIISTYDFDKTISNDDLLKPYLSKQADNRLKNIVSTIQKEQNEIIRYPINKNIIVQGIAGSGKTTVALHRLSYLLYNYKKQYKPFQYMILSPNQLFIDYVSTLLPELDAKDVLNYGLEMLVRDLSKMNLKILNKNAQRDKHIKNNQNYDYIKTKTSLEFASLIDEYVKNYEKNSLIKPFFIDNIQILSKDDVYEIYQKVDAKTTEERLDLLSKKIGQILRNNYTYRNNILTKLFESKVITFTKRCEIDSILERGCDKYVKKNIKMKYGILNVYKDFISNLDTGKYADIQTYTLQNLKQNIIAYDDIGAILYLYSCLYNAQKMYFDIRCIFIDEAQDLSVLIYMALNKFFARANFCIFGDIAQGIYSYQSITKWKELLNIFDNPEFLFLTKSYRTTIEIMQDANKTLKLLGLEQAQNVLRNGEPVDYITIQDREKDAIDILKSLIDKDYKTIAMLFKNDKELESFCAENDFIKIDESSTEYNGHYLLMTIKTAKGLEFDSVVIYNLSSYDERNDIDMKELFVAKTRALHKLVILQ